MLSTNNKRRGACLRGFLCITAFLLTSCGKETAKPTTSSGVPGSSGAEVQTLTLVFAYGSEKTAWVDAATAAFRASRPRLADGKEIYIEPRSMGSGDCVSQTLSGKLQAHIISPASEVFLKLGNAESTAKTGGPLTKASTNLVLSPVVIAMWKPMVAKLGWPQKPLGWEDIHALAINPQGWGSLGAPQWGQFRFGHTHPEYSNSGLLSVLAEVASVTKKVRGITLEDIAKPEVAAYVREIEQAVVHYGESTGFFAERLTQGGPSYLSAAVLYENMVVEANKLAAKNTTEQLVAIYPKEGTFWSDHPVATVNRPWVTAEHEAAAKLYLDHLASASMQAKALEFGFRPGDPSVPVGPPLEAAWGVDVSQPQTLLEVPDTAVVEGIRQLWAANKKASRIALVVDTSGSMKAENKIGHAREGAKTFLNQLGPRDQVSLLSFNNDLQWLMQDANATSSRAKLLEAVDGMFAAGGTHLYDAVGDAVGQLNRSSKPNEISAVVVLSDGADEGSATPLQSLLQRITVTPESPGIRVFTIAYGKGAVLNVLQQMATKTGGKAYTGDTQDITRIFREISTYF